MKRTRPARNIAAALEQLAASRPTPRRYRLRDVAVVLSAFAACLLAFDSAGLVTWAQRMDVGVIQSGWLAALSPLHRVMERARLTVPREVVAAAGERFGRALGAGEDPLLSAGWSTAPAAAVVPEPEPEPESAPLPAPAVELEREPVAAPVEDKPSVVTVLLVGDSMIAGSLGAAVAHSLARDKRLRVVSAFQTATGLSRPEVFDWMKVLPPLLERERPQLIICSFGANDATNIRDGEHQLDFGEAGWRQAYAARVTAMMRQFSGGDARVLWLGLPPMRESGFSERAQYLNGIFAQSARKVPRVEFLELGMLVSNGQREYATFLREPGGRLARFRLDDGVHYSPAGARAITRWVVDWVYERFRRLPRR